MIKGISRGCWYRAHLAMRSSVQEQHSVNAQEYGSQQRLRPRVARREHSVRRSGELSRFLWLSQTQNPSSERKPEWKDLCFSCFIRKTGKRDEDQFALCLATRENSNIERAFDMKKLFTIINFIRRWRLWLGKIEKMERGLSKRRHVCSYDSRFRTSSSTVNLWSSVECSVVTRQLNIR